MNSICEFLCDSVDLKVFRRKMVKFRYELLIITSGFLNRIIESALGWSLIDMLQILRYMNVLLETRKLEYDASFR